MAANRIGNSAGQGPVIGRDGLADTESFSIDETIAYGKDVAGNEDDVTAASDQDALIAAAQRSRRSWMVRIEVA